MRHLFDVEGYLALQEESGIALTVLSYALSEDDGDTPLDAVRAEHDFLAGLIDEAPGPVCGARRGRSVRRA